MNTLAPYQQRVVDEKLALDIKIESLRVHIESEFFKTLPDVEQGRQNRQWFYMRQYSNVLEERIDAWGLSA